MTFMLAQHDSSNAPMDIGRKGIFPGNTIKPNPLQGKILLRDREEHKKQGGVVVVFWSHYVLQWRWKCFPPMMQSISESHILEVMKQQAFQFQGLGLITSPPHPPNDAPLW